ncbi:hypothetical protein PHYSODRAFT_554226 [Phytophthora sojae]|uniref:Uncharacterized protein n=1 Tax=Phytophthora sojae (strain P6497) TaxID=1094619 RepID=G4YM70_PHYSP|nr:hypothetical protein PHYSODRAFT_554226 [Phytophthora sojae]EGZ27878.1 hypothetical protein PHYSODRAFT_554226 [Phytophthora sojae]|eukprot:XP_009515153.1 hypothetical protein PHYSODRAFT_554226 [Phytophthora sojae]
MFSSWDLVRPRFWYPMSSLEQSMMELEQMNDLMMRPRFPFGMQLDAPVMTMEDDRSESDSDSDDDDFFVDLPVVARKCMPTAFQLQVNKKHSNKQLRKHSYKITPTTERKITLNEPNDASERHTFSSYSFSNSSVVDDKGRRVTTTRRRYEDSTGRLKAVHEREIDGTTLRTTWSRQNKEDEGRHESICSSGSPEEFEALWQQTPFGEAQKRSVKGQLQSVSDVEKEVETTAAALKDTNMEDAAAKDLSVKESEKASTEKERTNKSRDDTEEKE